LKSWVIEGSIDGLGWTKLAREPNNHDLNGSLVIHSFSISKSIESRFVRLRQTGKNHANNDVLILYHFDLFGTLSDYAGNRCSSVATISPNSVSPSSSVIIDGTDTEIVMKSDTPLDGILSYLSRIYGGNVHERKIVTITASSIFGKDPQYSPTNLADLNSGLIFDSENEHNQWVQWDFNEMRVSPT
jgi:hypothetical protein